MWHGIQFGIGIQRGIGILCRVVSHGSPSDRLGALGFLGGTSVAATTDDGSSGNFGLQDTRSALRWVTRCRLRVVHAACCVLHVVGCMFSVACRVLHVVGCMLSVAYCVLHVVGCMLSVACRVLHVVGCMLSVACRVLHAVGCILPAARRTV